MAHVLYIKWPSQEGFRNIPQGSDITSSHLPRDPCDLLEAFCKTTLPLNEAQRNHFFYQYL